LIKIYVDADACPVKNEVYRVAHRYRLKVYVVSNSRMRIPQEDLFELVIVNEHVDAADDWIVEHVNENDIAVSGDIPLAARCLEAPPGVSRIAEGERRLTTEPLHPGIGE